MKRPGTNATEIFDAPCWPDDPSEGHPEIMPTSLHVYGIRNSVGAARTAGVDNQQSINCRLGELARYWGVRQLLAAFSYA